MELVWFDADGTVLGTIGQPQEEMWNPALSPDGTKVAVSAEENSDHWDIWIHDVAGNKSRLTFDTDREDFPFELVTRRQSDLLSLPDLRQRLDLHRGGGRQRSAAVADRGSTGHPEWDPDGLHP